MSKKRGAAQQITKDNFSKADEEPSEESQEFKSASEDSLKSRKFVKGKRRTGAADPEPEPEPEGEGPAAAGFPTFDFGIPADGVSFSWPDAEKSKDDSKEEKDGGFQWGGGAAPSFNWGSFESSAPPDASVHDPFAVSDESSSSSSSSESSIIQSSRPPVEFKAIGQQESGTDGDKTIHKVHAKVYILKDVSEAKEGEGGKGKEEEEEDNQEKEKSKGGGGGGVVGGKRFVECGQGELHLNTFSQNNSKRGRMVLRADKTQRLVLNTPLFKSMSYHIEGEKFLKFFTPPENGVIETYLLKFKAKEDAGQVKQHLDEIIATLK